MATCNEPSKNKPQLGRNKFTFDERQDIDWKHIQSFLDEGALADFQRTVTYPPYRDDQKKRDELTSQLDILRRLIEMQANNLRTLSDQVTQLFTTISSLDQDFAQLALERDMLVKGQTLQEIVTDLTK